MVSMSTRRTKPPDVAGQTRTQRRRPAEPRKRRSKSSGVVPHGFKPGTNSQSGEVFRRGPDLIPRKGMHALFAMLADADARTVKMIERDKGPSYRVLLAKAYVKAAKAKNPRLAMLAAEQLADRLEGKPVQSVVVRERRTTIFQGPPSESTPGAPNAPPAGQDDPESLVPALLPEWPAGLPEHP